MNITISCQVNKSSISAARRVLHPSPCTLHHEPSNVAGEQVGLHRNTVTSARALVVQLLRQRRQVLLQQLQAQPLPGARFRGGNEYAGTYPAKMSTMVHIFADGARIRARICAPVHVYAGGGGGGEQIRCYTGTSEPAFSSVGHHEFAVRERLSLQCSSRRKLKRYMVHHHQGGSCRYTSRVPPSLQ